MTSATPTCSCVVTDFAMPKSAKQWNDNRNPNDKCKTTFAVPRWAVAQAEANSPAKVLTPFAEAALRFHYARMAWSGDLAARLGYGLAVRRGGRSRQGVGFGSRAGTGIVVSGCLPVLCTSTRAPQRG